MGIEKMSDADQGKNQDLLENALEADLTGQLVIHNGAHDAGDVVDDYESQKRVKQAVTSSQEPSQPAADSGEYYLNGRPEFFNVVCPPLNLKMGMKKGTPQSALIPKILFMLLWSATPCATRTTCRHSFLGCTSLSRHRRCTAAE